jgi:hypothetical protein
MTKTLAPDDIRDLLNRFASAIMRDQVYVDALPRKVFHLQYDDDMWRGWRLATLAYLNTLLTTVNTIPRTTLKKLTRIAVTKDPAVVGQIAIELFADCASGSAPREDVETAALFFDRLIHELGGSSTTIPSNGKNARALMLRWLAFTDPLRISRDPECGYDNPRGLTS